jgi:hypothetical protein
MTSPDTNPETSLEKRKVDAWLVVARFIRPKNKPAPVGCNKLDFPTYTVICDDPNEAIEYVLGCGFSFSYGCWVLRAIHVGLM